MMISREHVKKIFKEYTDRYDASDGKIKLKIDHTYRVAEICERIAKSLALSAEDADLAWLLGMLHDVGRFEQLRRYGTFSDAQSIDHAHFGVELLYGNVDASGFSGENRMDSAEKSKEMEKQKIFLEEFVNLSSGEEAYQVIKTAIWNHSAFRIEVGLDERMEMFCHILRDADKVDIFKVCQDTPVEVIYNVTTEEVRHAGVTEEVMKQFFEKHAVLRSAKKTPVDHLVGHAALAFELVYPESLKVAKEQGYLQKILAYPSENEKTVEQLRELREFLEEYLENIEG
ncbi:MAG: HD domain-containing protein [Lachnospiraceae bacterium]|nr:HD domain-containing protein [Lachnospiraceae bacterium]